MPLLSNQDLNIASTMAWIWTIMVGHIFFYRLIVSDRFEIDYFILTFGMAVCAFAIRKKIYPFNWVATGMSVIMFILCIITYFSKLSVVGIIIHFFIVIFLIDNWRSFDK